MKIKALVTTLTLTLLTLGIYHNALAAENPLAQVVEAIDKLVMGYGRETLLNETLTPFTLTETDIDAFASEQGLGQAMPKDKVSVSPPFLVPALQNNPARTKNLSSLAVVKTLLATNPSKTVEYMANLPIPTLDPKGPCASKDVSASMALASGTANRDCPPMIPEEQTANYDAGNLIEPTAYRDNGLSAYHYVDFLSGMASPYATMNPEDVKDKTSSSYLTYQVTLRSYAANITAGVANLYHLILERLPMSADHPLSPGTKVGLGMIAQLPPSSPSFPEGKASELQVDQYTAIRRFTDPKWQQTIQTANQQTLMREQLYLLAEMRYELFQSRMELERLTTAMSAMQLQQANMTQRTALEQLKNKPNF